MGIEIGVTVPPIRFIQDVGNYPVGKNIVERDGIPLVCQIIINTFDTVSRFLDQLFQVSLLTIMLSQIMEEQGSASVMGKNVGVIQRPVD